METREAAGIARPGAVRKRRGASDGPLKLTCEYCGRTFKRSEHKERHVRTHTKEKPFVCHCSAAFTRRDLLTRHQRITSHSSQDNRSQDSRDQDAGSEQSDQPVVEADMAAAVSLSDMSMNPWNHQLANGHAPDLPQQVLSQPFQQPLLPQEYFDPGQAIAGYDHFRDFANFLDGVGLPPEWSPYFSAPEPEEDLVDPQLREPGTDAATPIPRTGRSGSPFSTWLPSAPHGSRIAEVNSDNRPRGVDTDSQPFRVTEDQHARLAVYLDSFRGVVNDEFVLPSRHALTRYITSYFQGFHLHMPFIHQQTWRVLDSPLELVLAIATMGAQYSFEHRNSERLFQAGKAVLLERLLHESEKFGPKTSSFLSMHNYYPLGARALSSSRPKRDSGPWEPVDTVRALIILMGYATWERKEKFVAEAFSLQSLLVQVLRDVGLLERSDPDSPMESASPQTAWLAWVRQESVRRTKLIAFTFLHTHSVAYNVYPVLRSNEIHLRLPCSTGEWRALNAVQWKAARRDLRKEQLNFQDALSLLLRHDGSAPLDPIPTPLGNYCLLHGLLQRIHIVRDLSLPIMDHSASLPGEEVNKLERGLRSWTSGWQQQTESSLDPNNENGPIPFTSSSLLALAYVRIYLNLGPYRQLETRDPSRVARALYRSPRVDRSNGVISALLYATHALSIPVRLGVDRVARSQAFFWSVRHSLSGLECAVLLSKWLHSVSEFVDEVPLTDSEDRILHWVRCVVEEAFAVVDFEEDEPIPQSDPASLSLAVLKIWAHFFKSNTQWPFINIIGRSLEAYREMLVRGNTQQQAT
ncbi:hypothetical protein JX265_002413 [Neoarthrinium moseri]|uniref:C2H2-type domain-containing protein n=1 Tax=Neoarthrinium moseri TaxID=1658444 RepID=A0A9Q0AQD8_9PEZI|nr:hypothetical protein JX266_000894 [Neoarthrinium moseri]KAI1879459.1 hypothetical protein JX265_002413 [Neoarthrinium moseri]